MVTLTPKAAAQVKARLAKDGKPGGVLRLKVATGGCSGMSYEFGYADAPEAGDQVFAAEGARLAVDPKAYFFVNGSTVDWHQTLMESGFKVTNPNATASCSCGTSFSTF
ncbi:MAG: iron-sulfur cluster assembly accessory protein [Elusimicrobia bacterium]|nr:iron-sulfur cluster assembly accessory protein [Elusimicrobiota bacterium]